MRPDTAESEIIPPRHARARVVRGLDDETLNLLASLLDDMFRVPGTAIRFGLDPLIGLIPGIGDLISGLAAFLIIFALLIAALGLRSGDAAWLAMPSIVPSTVTSRS